MEKQVTRNNIDDDAAYPIDAYATKRTKDRLQETSKNIIIPAVNQLPYLITKRVFDICVNGLRRTISLNCTPLGDNTGFGYISKIIRLLYTRHEKLLKYNILLNGKRVFNKIIVDMPTWNTLNYNADFTQSFRISFFVEFNTKDITICTIEVPPLLDTTYIEKVSLSFIGKSANRYVNHINRYINKAINVKKHSCDMVFENYAKIGVYTCNNRWDSCYSYWKHACSKQKVYHLENNHIYTKIDNMLRSKELYDEYAIPYKFVSILHGPPGTGKTKTINAVLHHINLTSETIVYECKPPELRTSTDVINSSIISDLKLDSCGNRHFEKEDKDKKLYKIIIIEELDLFGGNLTRGESSNTSITDTASRNMLSAVMDLFDGKWFDSDSSIFDGVVILATTNNIDALDPALIRPGRVDYLCEYKNLTYEQGLEFINFDKFKLTNEQLSNIYKGRDVVSPAEIEQCAMEIIQEEVNRKMEENNEESN